MQTIFTKAKDASFILKNASAAVRSGVIRDISEMLLLHKDRILAENSKDIEAAQQNGLSTAMIDRLLLTESRISELSENIMNIAQQQDPVGEVVSGNTRPNGLRMVKIRVPMGVVGIIYESRPNVTIDCAALCMRSGNVAILRGGKEAINSNKILTEVVHSALEKNGLPTDSVTLLDDPDRTLMIEMIQAKGFVDLIIPRGGKPLINFVSANAHVPVIKHDNGVCSIFVDESADFIKAVKIVHNAKVSKPSACNAVETLLVHEKIAVKFLPLVKEKMVNVTLKGCPKTRSIIDVESANDEWYNEFLDYTLNIRVIGGVDEAVSHINKYGSSHSDSIITEDYSNAELFLDKVDSACVYVNASTRFTDGGEFGLGAEVGISTDKIHSRGPMGAFDLTTTKYKIYGNGQIR